MAGQRCTFKAQHGFFTHDDDPESWDFRATTRPLLGIKTREYATDSDFEPKEESTQWQRLEHYVRHMNTLNPTQQRWKIFYIIRHGQGIHNVKHDEVGREEWDRYWSKLSGDGHVVWEDAELTPFGEQQAEAIASFFGRGEVPLPDVIFSSPLRRCLETTKIAYKDDLAMVGSTSESIRRPLVKEKLRERLGVHLCDKRSTKCFTEEDELWKADVRETLDEHMTRAAQLLEDIFEREGDEAIVSLTAHSGALMALFGATGWKKVPVAAGAVYPLLVVAEKVSTEGQ
ncbi:putative phosphoglycerate mutase pmu1 [Didymosphaeria variabile]|uniref:Phosphoglycerate mutase pmu1 n=1 Tax=Didymosphaeria variabile TaxID=1932322 RepID=A0A9W8XVG1_9PLEO|nr:putative phosphoglycerate mutase pmu1 [Didymosphaeria variabile]KAJ4360517.1 putative phosphoglycerate mutase pmu1 [Didymosphaeria variabile]